MRKVSLVLLFCFICLTGMAQGQKALDLKDITSDVSVRKTFRESSLHPTVSTTRR